MTLRLLFIASLIAVASSGEAQAQEILFTNNAAYVTNGTPRVTLNGYLRSVVQSGDTYQFVGIVLSNSFSTYNDVFNPAANFQGTTFAYAKNAPFGTLPSSMTWQSDMALPVKSISTDPSNRPISRPRSTSWTRTGTPTTIRRSRTIAS